MAVVHTWPVEPTLTLAFARLGEVLASLPQPAPRGDASGTSVALARLEVEVGGVSEPAHWLSHQQVYPRVYFSDQNKSLRAAGVGAAERISSPGPLSEQAWAQAFQSLAGASPRMRFYGGMRFDMEAEQHEEWAAFGGSVFILPLWELQVRGQWMENVAHAVAHLLMHVPGTYLPAVPSAVVSTGRRLSASAHAPHTARSAMHRCATTGAASWRATCAGVRPLVVTRQSMVLLAGTRRRAMHSL